MFKKRFVPLQARVSMRMKLIFGIGLLVAMFGAVSAFTMIQVRQIAQQITFQNEEMGKQRLALELKLKVNELDAMKSALLVSKKTDIASTYYEKSESFYKLTEAVSQTASSAQERKWSAQLSNTAKEFTASFDRALTIVNDTKLAPAEQMSELARIHDLSQVHKEFIFELVGHFNDMYASEAAAAVAGSDLLLAKSMNVTIISFIVVLIAGGLATAALVRSFLLPISRLQAAVKRIAGGDLRTKINDSSQDELGRLSRDFDHMVDEVRDTLTNTRSIASMLSEHARMFNDHSSSTAAANQEIVRSMQEIATGAEQQASYSEQSSDTIASLAGEVKDIAGFTDTMQQKNRIAAFNTHTGLQSIHSLEQAAQQSEQVLVQMNESMSTLSHSSVQIGEIVRSITDISTQTHVLSFNAAIEAARAGEHGRGFAVIAEEVRELSARTGESSKRIAGIVSSLLDHMKHMEEALVQVRASFTLQTGKVNESAEAFREIRSSMDELSGHINEIHSRIAAAESKNSRAVESIQHVAAIAEETAAGVQDVTSASLQQDRAIHQIALRSSDIRKLADGLFEEIKRFDIGEEAADREPAPSDGEIQNNTAANREIVNRTAAVHSNTDDLPETCKETVNTQSAKDDSQAAEPEVKHRREKNAAPESEPNEAVPETKAEAPSSDKENETEEKKLQPV